MPDSFGLDLSSPFGGGSSDTGSSFTPKTGNLPSMSDFLGGGGSAFGSDTTLPGTNMSADTLSNLSSGSPLANLNLGNLGGGGVLGDIGNLVGGFLGGTGGSSLGNILGSAVNYGVPLAMAKQAQQTNQARADELKRVGQPLLDTGMGQLGSYGTLTDLQKQALDTAVATGKTTAGRGQPLIDIGTRAFGEYQAGNLPAWQQAQLDQKVAQQKALARQSLGANVDSTTLAQLDAQIDNQAQIAKGQMLQSNLATGEASYGEGVGYETDGGQAQAAAYRNAVTDVNNNLSNALKTITTGLGPMEDAINLEIQSDTAISKALMEMYGAIAKASTPSTVVNVGSAGGGEAGEATF